MAQLSTKIKLYVGSEVDFLNDVLLQDDGQGAYIKEWNLDIEKPTLQQLEQYNDVADFDDAMKQLREKRDNLLIQSDWVVLPDSPVADKTAWETYRTQLRDITNGLTTVEEVIAVVFPTKPN